MYSISTWLGSELEYKLDGVGLSYTAMQGHPGPAAPH